MKVFIFALASVLALSTAHAQAISGAYSGQYSSPQPVAHASKSVSVADVNQSSQSSNSGNVSTVSFVSSAKEYSLVLVEKQSDGMVGIATLGAPMTRYTCEQEARDLYKTVNDWAKYENVMAVSCMKLGIADGDSSPHSYGPGQNISAQPARITSAAFMGLSPSTYSLIIMPSDHAGYEIPNFRSKANCEAARQNIQTTVFTAHEQVLRCERK
jgi:hypothetical protein